MSNGNFSDGFKRDEVLQITARGPCDCGGFQATRRKPPFNLRLEEKVLGADDVPLPAHPSEQLLRQAKELAEDR